MPRQSYAGTPAQFQQQVVSAVDRLSGSIESQLLYRQLTDENKAVVRGLLKEVETRFRFVRKFQFTDKATNGDEQSSSPNRRLNPKRNRRTTC